MNAQSIKYHLYGRKEYPTPLTFLTEITVPTADALRIDALREVGAEGWVELIAFRQDDAIEVIRK